MVLKAPEPTISPFPFLFSAKIWFEKKKNRLNGCSGLIARAAARARFGRTKSARAGGTFFLMPAFRSLKEQIVEATRAAQRPHPNNPWPWSMYASLINAMWKRNGCSAVMCAASYNRYGCRIPEIFLHWGSPRPALLPRDSRTVACPRDEDCSSR